MQKKIIRQAMNQQDEWVIEFSYLDSKGQLTRRIASPIRFLGNDRFLALCLCREEPRQFYLERCTQLVARRASECLMPVKLESIDVASALAS